MTTRTKLTNEEKAWRRSQRKAEKLNAKAIAEAGLFAEVPGEVTPTTAAEQYWKNRSLRASGIEGAYAIYCQAVTGLEELRVSFIERYAASVLGEAYGPVRAAIRRTYPSHSYWSQVWKALLTRGDRVVFGYKNVPGLVPVTEWNKDGSKILPIGFFPPEDWAPPLTPGRYDTMFPIVEVNPDPGPEPDDGGLFERVMRSLERH